MRPIRPAARIRRVTRSASATQDRVQPRLRARPATERGLEPERASPTTGAHPPGVAIAGDGVQVAPGRGTEQRHDRGLGELGKLTDGLDPGAPHAAGGRRADAPQSARSRAGAGTRARARGRRRAGRPASLHGSPSSPASWSARSRPSPPARFRSRASARRRRAISSGEPAIRSSPATSRNASSSESPSTTGAVRRKSSNSSSLASHVGGESRRDDDRVRAQAAGPSAAHRPAHTAAPRLVAGRHHHPLADDHGATAQTGIVALLDRGEERIGVGVEDRRLRRRHEHTFAYAEAAINPDGRLRVVAGDRGGDPVLCAPGGVDVGRVHQQREGDRVVVGLAVAR